MPRFRRIDGERVQFTAEEETARDAEEAKYDAEVVAQDSVQYQQDRRENYLPVGDQLDLIYWDKVNGTELWDEHVAAVQAAHPTPAA